MKRAKPIRLPGAPGLWLCAGLVDTAAGSRSVTGTGESAQLAEARMRSEAAEAMALAQCKDAPSLYGIAAADEIVVAEEAARCELVERYAAMLWWRGERPAAFPAEAACEAFERKRRTYQHQREGSIGLLDLSLGDDLSVMLAWSCEPDGPAPCFGIAAHRDEGEAAGASLRELCQMEFGLALARRRQDAGQPLGGTDQSVVDRASALTISDCPITPSMTREESVTPLDITTRLLASKYQSRHVALAEMRNLNSVDSLTSTGAALTLQSNVQPLREPGLEGWPLYL